MSKIGLRIDWNVSGELVVGQVTSIVGHIP